MINERSKRCGFYVWLWPDSSRNRSRIYGNQDS